MAPIVARADRALDRMARRAPLGHHRPDGQG
jgi:hypothetical protein